MSPDAASESPLPLTDRVELSERQPAGADADLARVYQAFRRVQTMPAEESGPEAEDAQETSPLSLASLSDLQQRIRQSLVDFSGSEQSALVQQFDETSDWLQAADPELYGTYLLLLKVLSEQNPDRVGDLLGNVKKLQPLLGTVDLAGDAVTVRMVHINIESTVTAQSVDLEAARTEAHGRLEAGSITVRVRGEAIRVETIEQQAQQGDPVVLDLDGDGIDLRSAEEGVQFDLTGDGKAEQTAFVQGDDALLFVDRNGNGIADTGTELFGDQEGDAHGFAKLRRFDGNGDQLIDESDALYQRLRLWQDRNGDGVNQIDETLTLEEAGVLSLGLDFLETDEEDGKGNAVRQISSFLRRDGARGLMVDALLKYYA
ncbi:MAG: hypothetical protein ACOCX4_06595 [Planctomycetota bacterium]